MSTVAIRFGGTQQIARSVPVHLHGSPVDPPAAATPIIAKSGEDASELYPSAACELDLLSAAKEGDQHAFVELCRCHSPYLKRRIRRMVRNPADAEDVFQETLLSAFRHLSGFRAQCTFRTWIMKIATNTSLMLLRKQRNRHETGFGLVTAEGKEVEILQVSDPMPNPEQRYTKRQASRRVSEAIKRLPAGFRVLVERYHQDEIKLEDAAKSIGITLAAAKSRLFRARIALRRHLTDDKKRVS